MGTCIDTKSFQCAVYLSFEHPLTVVQVQLCNHDSERFSS
uniref:Uncharacterized protein n=1 Tax=Arundo donax TaxID=35708 RepID=A0A0A9A2Q4_ARUDO